MLVLTDNMTGTTRQRVKAMMPDLSKLMRNRAAAGDIKPKVTHNRDNGTTAFASKFKGHSSQSLFLFTKQQ